MMRNRKQRVNNRKTLPKPAIFMVLYLRLCIKVFLSLCYGAFGVIIFYKEMERRKRIHVGSYHTQRYPCHLTEHV
jgi:hypothetical protein